MFVSFPKVPET